MRTHGNGSKTLTSVSTVHVPKGLSERVGLGSVAAMLNGDLTVGDTLTWMGRSRGASPKESGISRIILNNNYFSP